MPEGTSQPSITVTSWPRPLSLCNVFVDIRGRREGCSKKRMAGNKERKRGVNRKLVDENQHLFAKDEGSERATFETANGVIEEMPVER